MEHELFPAESILAGMTRWPDPDVVVADPEFVALPPVARALVDYGRKHPHVGICAIGELTPAFSSVVVALGESRTTSVVLSAFDREAALFSRVREAVVQVIPERVLWLLSTHLDLMPPALSAAIRSAFRVKAQACGTMEDVAARAGVDVRTVYRRCKRVGLLRPKELLRAARFLHGIPLILSNRHRLSAVASLLGYGDYEQFQLLTRRLTGLSPRELRHRAHVERLAPSIVTALLAQSGRSSSFSMVSSVPKAP